MELAELRSGNIVKTPSGEVFRFSPWSLNSIYIRKSLGGSTVFDPVELSEDWLLNLGFEKRVYKSSDDVFLDEVFYELEDNEFFIRYEDDFSMTLYESSKTHLNKLGIVIPFEKARYVHQLQNLYFALSGEELKIKQI